MTWTISHDLHPHVIGALVHFVQCQMQTVAILICTVSAPYPAVGLVLLPIPYSIGIDLQHRVVELEAMRSTVEIDIGDALSTETRQPLLAQP